MLVPRTSYEPIPMPEEEKSSPQSISESIATAFEELQSRSSEGENISDFRTRIRSLETQKAELIQAKQQQDKENRKRLIGIAFMVAAVALLILTITCSLPLGICLIALLLFAVGVAISSSNTKHYNISVPEDQVEIESAEKRLLHDLQHRLPPPAFIPK